LNHFSISRVILAGFLACLMIGCAESEPEIISANFDGDVLVGRPTDQGASVSVMSFSDTQVYVEYGAVSGQYDLSTETEALGVDEIQVFELAGLESDTEYFYRIRFGSEDTGQYFAGAEFSFNTQRSAGSTFSFAVQADPHLGARTRFEKWCGDRCTREAADDKVYAVTATNMLAYDPDFVVDLGDTFMTAQNHQNGLFPIQERQGGAPITENEVIEDVRYLRELFTQVGSSIPIMLVQGNHEAEDSARLNGTPDNMAVWAVNNRKKYFPSPTDNGFYSGSTVEYEFIGRQDGYFSWEWGDALFVALDPFWVNAPREVWSRTLGREQYDWLKNTLEASDAKFKFVFLHHLVGGFDNPYGSSRGGALYSDYFEWGGRTPFDYEAWSPENIQAYNALPSTDTTGPWPLRRVDSSTESYDFDEYRPGWGVPIQQMLLDNNVQIVFHGHDHIYVKEVHDNGIVYQEVPQPSRAGGEMNEEALMLSAGRQGYDTEKGVVISAAGFLNVTVSPDQATVDYVKNIENCTQEPCREIADSYTIYAE
jgi:hypothetical protein